MTFIVLRVFLNRGVLCRNIIVSPAGGREVIDPLGVPPNEQNGRNYRLCLLPQLGEKIVHPSNLGYTYGL